MFKDFISLIFPDVCIYCQRPVVQGEKLLCTSCLFDLPKTNDHKLSDGELIDKFVSFPEVEFVYSFLKFTKKGMVQRLLHHLKYKGNKEIGVMLGRWYGIELKQRINEKFDLILPVPLHQSKLRTRGYNQSDQIAQGLSESLDITWNAKLIKRIKKTSTQTKMGKVERWKNVEKIFEVADPEMLSGKSVLLVDDVITTGATLNSCIEELLASKVKSLGIVTIARAF